MGTLARRAAVAAASAKRRAALETALVAAESNLAALETRIGRIVVAGNRVPARLERERKAAGAAHAAARAALYPGGARKGGAPAGAKWRGL
jgi:hypothetical protein